ncbi:MAG TPA: tetratricopeptide repeat protein [Sphingobacteriaceae bacterium]|nr:tetratricopeptide repeat protein [Sphingobacteriaceae bacterium]
MQNLTARYNVLYNARILIEESERNISGSYQDNFDRLLPVFKESSLELAQSELKSLDKVIEKMNVIVNEKSQSQYVDDAYFLIAKANHLKGEFFNSAEFFDYVYKNYPEDKEKKQAALAWKARALIKLNRFDEAKITIDTALENIKSEKKSLADIFAVAAQLHIYAKNEVAAAEVLEKAIKETDSKINKLRWSYLLGQLQELNGQSEAAYENYTAIVKSNAAFDMAFNSNLNRIAIEDKISGKSSSGIDRLSALLKDDKNKQFSDQIYYEIANTYFAQGEQVKAIENYNTAIRSSVNNQGQKGQAYLSLADIYFNQADYVKSKAYYDSTLLNLTPEYPGYQQIKKKGDNLYLLSDRLSIISREDTLQMLAKLPEEARKIRIGALARAQVQEVFAQTETNNNSGNSLFDNNRPTENAAGGKFYFNNTAAISQGFSDFKRRWGNRTLEDNWRRSQKSASEVTNSNASGLSPDDVITGTPNNSSPIKSAEDIQIDIQNIPLTDELRMASNQRIASAYFDIGDFYKDILNEPAQAIKAYEDLLNRFPDSENKLAIYYNLYRLYSISNPQKAEEYKNTLLTRYADSQFAKIILDPGYRQSADDEPMAAIRFYEDMYSDYLSKKYKDVILKADQAHQQFAKNSLASQISYLGALAIGRTQKLPAFEQALKLIISEYPDDKLIVPLIQQHLLYIIQYRPELDKRRVALVDYDPNEPGFVEEPQIQLTDVKPIIAGQPKTSVSEPETKIATTPETKIAASPETPANVSRNEPSIFAVADSMVHYFVVNVAADSRVNLNSSRFGIGQFNRANFSGKSIKHQLKNINNQNQLIFVGEFRSKDLAMGYYQNISPLMKDIMKITADKYSTFIITKDNFDKLNDRPTIEKYIEFYQKNY